MATTAALPGPEDDEERFRELWRRAMRGDQGALEEFRARYGARARKELVVRRARATRDALHQAPGGACGAGGEAARDSDAGRLEAALERLAPADRELVRLRAGEAADWSEVARRTGLASAGAARVAFRDAVERLAQCLREG